MLKEIEICWDRTAHMFHESHASDTRIGISANPTIGWAVYDDNEKSMQEVRAILLKHMYENAEIELQSLTELHKQLSEGNTCISNSYVVT